MECYNNEEQLALISMQKCLDSLSVIYQPIFDVNMREMVVKTQFIIAIAVDTLIIIKL